MLRSRRAVQAEGTAGGKVRMSLHVPRTKQSPCDCGRVSEKEAGQGLPWWSSG